MRQYTISKIAQGLLLIFVVTIMIFLLLQLMPGDPIAMITSERTSEEKKIELTEKFGLDKPIYIQYFTWLGNVVTGDLGTSIRTQKPVLDEIGHRLPYTLKLVGTSLFLQFSLGIPLGLLAAYKKDTIVDKIIIVITSILSAIPSFWLAIILILIFSLTLGVLPSSGSTGAKSFILPIIAITLGGLSGIIRLTKSEILEVYSEKFIVTGYAKGLENRKVLFRHILRNALIPVCVMLFLSIPWMIGGSVIIESIFGLPGMGNMLWSSISTQDFPVVQGCIFFVASLTVICNTLGDIVTAYLDPRVRVALKGGN